jgi:hypothetical protein
MYHRDRLCCCDHFDDFAAVLRCQHIAATQQQAARQHESGFAAIVQGNAGAAFNTHINWQRHAGGDVMGVIQALG